MKKKYFVVLVVLVIAAGCTPKPPQIVLPAPEPYVSFATSTPVLPSPVAEPEQPKPPTPVEVPIYNPEPEQKPTVEKPVPASVNLAVPFRSQAPFGDWSEPYQNGCEEASIIMVDYYLRGASLSAQQMKDAIDAQVAWQFKNFGSHPELPIAMVKDLAESQYSYTIQIIPDLTVEKIRQQLQKGIPVIVPTAGRELGNPYFTSPGPIYHMLVIKGYTADGKFITNDPGTRHGAEYVYSAATLMNAIRDWDEENQSPDGGKVGLVLYR